MDNTPFNWTCPYCQRATTIVNENTEDSDLSSEKLGLIAYTRFILCPNIECKKTTVKFELWKGIKKIKYDNSPKIFQEESLIKSWQLVPASSALVFPDYIPEAIRNDYTEACLILESSPKASATLSRRCIQGIIRDYWKVKPGWLADEIKQIKDKTDGPTWQAIDAVRSVGNIGAHMEKDVNLLVDIDPNEATLLIKLIEDLLNGRYATKHDQEQRLKDIVAMSKDKKTTTPVKSSEQ
jgi:hypothetical protein